MCVDDLLVPVVISALPRNTTTGCSPAMAWKLPALFAYVNYVMCAESRFQEDGQMHPSSMIIRDVDSLYLNMQDGGTTSPRNQQWPKVKDVIVDEGASAAGVRRLSGSTEFPAPEWMTGENVEHKV